MKVRTVVAAAVIAAAAVAPVAASGQEAAPRTPWGHPDLQGTYTNKTITPLQRPAELAGRELLTAEEVANIEGKPSIVTRSCSRVRRGGPRLPRT